MTSDTTLKERDDYEKNNNDLVGKLPEAPHQKLRSLADLLVGRWRFHGETIEGEASFELMEGGFYLIHRFDLRSSDGGHQKGVEYIGWNEKTETLRSRLFGTNGSRFTYTWELERDQLITWFGDKGSEIVSKGKVVSSDKIEAAWRGLGENGDAQRFSYKLERID